MAFKTQNGYCTRKEAAELLNVSIRTIENYTSRGILKNYAPIAIKGRQEIRLRIKDVETLKPHIDEFDSIEQTIEEYKAKLKAEQDALYEDYMSLSKLGTFKNAFYYRMPEILESMFAICDPLQDREKNILTAILQGASIESVMEAHQLTRGRIRQLVNKASRIVHNKCLSQCAARYQEVIQANERLKQENEMIRRTYLENLTKLSKYEERSNLLDQLDNPNCTVTGSIDTIKLLLTKTINAGFSVRCFNCLALHDVTTVAELVSFRRSELMKFRNLGRKSLTEIDDFIEKNNLEFGMNLTEYGFVRTNGGMWTPTQTVLDIMK